MIKVKITKNIIRNGTVFANLTWKQIIILGISLSLSAIMLLILKDKMNFDLLMTLVFVQIVITMAMGVVQIQGLSLFKFMILALKGPIVRQYHSEGVFTEHENGKKSR